MKMTDVFGSGQMKNTNAQAANSQTVLNHAQGASVGRQIQALTPGQTLQGEVVARDGNQVQIKVADDFILEARVDQSMNLEVGRFMTFEVRNNGQILQLSPLFANTATQANALKALEMASLPVTQNTVAMTGLMMEAGLSIDKTSLQQMFRQMNAFPDSPVSDVVDLHRLGLAVNEENVAQIHSYKNLTHQLVTALHTVQESLVDTMGSMMEEGNVEGAARLFQEVWQMVQEIADGDAQTARDGFVNDSGEQSLVDFQGNVLDNKEQVSPDETVMEQNGRGIVENQNERETARADEKIWTQTANNHEEAQVKPETDRIREALTDTVKQTNNDLLQQLNQAVREENFTDQMKVLQELLKRGGQEGDKMLLATLVNRKDVQKILSEGLSRMWTITPEEVADSGKVEELYSRLNRQLKSLSHILEQNAESQSTAYKAVSNMARNVDFLQQINQAYTYVQLPLRLQSGETHGDLYVYTNKRNLSAKEGEISALLHLDMEHLGPVDVYVAMRADKVNTRFYVQDDEMLDFLEQHMDILTQRLQKRGYNCDFTMQVRGDESAESGLKGLLAKEQTQPVAQYAFDVRA